MLASLPRENDSSTYDAETTHLQRRKVIIPFNGYGNNSSLHFMSRGNEKALIILSEGCPCDNEGTDCDLGRSEEDVCKRRKKLSETINCYRF